MIPVVSNPGTITLKSAAVILGYCIAITAILVNTALPKLASIWGWHLPLDQMQQTWNVVLVPILSGFGINGARIWNQNLPNGGNS